MRRRDSLYNLVNTLVGAIIGPNHPVAMSGSFASEHFGDLRVLPKVVFG
jgi:hypothetical protein